MTIPDPVSAVRTFVAADAAVAALAAARVYAGELLDTEAANMPRYAVVISAAGGAPSRDYARLGRTRIDVRSYGERPYLAMKLSLAVHEALKHLERETETPGPVLIHSVTPEGGPTHMRDADGDWPVVLRSYEVLAAEAVAA